MLNPPAANNQQQREREWGNFLILMLIALFLLINQSPANSSNAANKPVAKQFVNDFPGPIAAYANSVLTVNATTGFRYVNATGIYKGCAR